MRQLVYTMFITNNRASFQLRRKEDLVKHQKVSKYYGNDRGFHASSKNILSTQRKGSTKSTNLFNKNLTAPFEKVQ